MIFPQKPRPNGRGFLIPQRVGTQLDWRVLDMVPDQRGYRIRTYRRIRSKCPITRVRAVILLKNEKDATSCPFLRAKLLAAIEAVEGFAGELVSRDLLRPFLKEEGLL